MNHDSYTCLRPSLELLEIHKLRRMKDIHVLWEFQYNYNKIRGGGGDASPTIWKVGDIISNVHPRFWGPDFFLACLLACLSERLVMYEDTSSSCLENWPKILKKEKKCRSPPPPPPKQLFQAWRERSNVSPTFWGGISAYG